MESHKIIQVEEKVPLKLLLPLSIQHMFAMFGASVLVPFIFGINPAIVSVVGQVKQNLMQMQNDQLSSRDICWIGNNLVLKNK